MPDVSLLSLSVAVSAARLGRTLRQRRRRVARGAWAGGPHSDRLSPPAVLINLAPVAG